MTEKENITAYPTSIKRIIKEHYKQLHSHKFDNLEEMNPPKNMNNQNSTKIK